MTMQEGRRAHRSRLAVLLALVLLAGLPGATAAVVGDTAPPVGTLTIGTGAAATNDPSVVLHVPATDDLSGVATIHVADGATSWTTFPYSDTIPWTLPAWDGTHSISVYWTDGEGNDSAVVQASVLLDRVPPGGAITTGLSGGTGEDVWIELHWHAADNSGSVTEQQASSDGSTWASVTSADLDHWRFLDPAVGGSPQYGPRIVFVRWGDAAGNWSSPASARLYVFPNVPIDFPEPAVTGKPFTIHPRYPANTVVPAGSSCMWELFWGDDASLKQNKPDETYGYLQIKGPSSEGYCSDWTFDLPAVPYPQFMLYFSFLVPLGPSPGALVGDRPTGDPVFFTATQGSTDYRIDASSLPLVQLIPSTFTPIVGSPVTYTAHRVGKVPPYSRSEWSILGGLPGSYRLLKAQVNGSSFTYTPTAPGPLTVFWTGHPSEEYLLGAQYEAPARYRDWYAPTTTAPVQTIAGGSLDETVPVTLHWTGRDIGWGIGSYRLQQSTDGGTWRSVALPTPRTTTLTRRLAPGHTYRFRVRATDKAGNVGAWRYGPSFRPRVTQETSSHIVYRRTWSALADPLASGGGRRQTIIPLATATYAFTGRDVAWVAARGPGHGRARVFVDGLLVRTIDLLAATDAPRRIVFRRHWAASASHTIRIVVEGTAGRPLVDLDAFVVIR